MDHEQRLAAVRQNDPVLAAEIVKNIKKIEDDHHLASGPLSERLMREAVQVIVKGAAEPWQVIETDWTAQIVCPDWKVSKGVGFDAWLELAEICGEDVEREYSWISAAVGAGDTRMGIELAFRRGLVDTAQGLMRDEKLVAPLLKAGMVREESVPRLFWPIDIPAGLLAQAFSENDLAKALVPVGKAVEKALAAKAALDAFLASVRTEAKRK